MAISDGKLETDLLFAPLGTPIYGISWDLNLSFKHANVHLYTMYHAGVTCLLWDTAFNFD